MGANLNQEYRIVHSCTSLWFAGKRTPILRGARPRSSSDWEVMSWYIIFFFQFVPVLVQFIHYIETSSQVYLYPKVNKDSTDPKKSYKSKSIKNGISWPLSHKEAWIYWIISLMDSIVFMQPGNTIKFIKFMFDFSGKHKNSSYNNIYVKIGSTLFLFFLLLKYEPLY